MKIVQQRTHPRLSIHAEWELRVLDRWELCTVGDLSEGGARILSERSPTEGEEVVLRTGTNEGIEIAGTVLRSAPTFFIVEFVKAESRRRAVESLRAAAHSYWP